jgi:hypothetical protein
MVSMSKKRTVVADPQHAIGVAIRNKINQKVAC